MNFDPPATPRPRQQPTQQPAGEGSDPAALVAARTAAVARNRQREARATMVRDILRIVGVLALVGGVALLVYLRHRYRVEEERQRAAEEAAVRAEQAKERAGVR